MTQVIQQKLNDKAWARWTALVLIASMMFFAYMFVDVMSPIQALIEKERGWNPDVFGTYAAGEYILNVCGFLIIAGFILDKMGVPYDPDRKYLGLDEKDLKRPELPKNLRCF